ncbi:hypothetical protein KWH09_22825 [Xanthomonas campestris pv. olitorii]
MEDRQKAAGSVTQAGSLHRSSQSQSQAVALFRKNREGTCDTSLALRHVLFNNSGTIEYLRPDDPESDIAKVRWSAYVYGSLMRLSKVAIFSVGILCITSLCACAHTPGNPISPLPKEPRAMTTPNTSTVNPTLSAVEIGERFLKLLGGLDSRKDLTIDRVREVTGISLKKVSFPSEGLESYIHGQALSNGWSYLLELTPESRALKQGIGLSFVNEDEGSSSLQGNCVDFEKYRDSLIEMGFLDSPVHGEIGQLQSWRFAKLANDGSGNDIVISLVPQNEAPGSPGRLCVKSIGTLN